MKLLTAAALLFSSLLICTSVSADEVQLTPEEVREVFIDTPWHNDFGAFIFRADGTYSFKEHNQNSPRGTWDYEMLEDGSLRGGRTTYTFYKDGDKYLYFHSRSKKYYDAYPNKEPFM